MFLTFFRGAIVLRRYWTSSSTVMGCLEEVDGRAGGSSTKTHLPAAPPSDADECPMSGSGVDSTGGGCLT